MKRGWKKGFKHSEKAKKKISRTLKKKYKNKEIKNVEGENNPAWKGGKIIRRGYVFIYSPNHPYKNNHNKVREHRLVIEKHLGRYLKPEEVVHHRNEIRDDNRLKNLILFKNDNEHKDYHKKQRRLK